jgi:hypothetical protein
MEFTNYKPINVLDPPVDDLSEESPISKPTIHLPLDTFTTHPMLIRLAIDMPYVQKHLDILQQKGVPSLHELKYSRNCLPTLCKSKILFLDLDETLCHTYVRESKINEDDSRLSDKEFMMKRPFAIDFIQKVSEHYDIIVIA